MKNNFITQDFTNLVKYQSGSPELRIGLVTLSTDLTIEHDFHVMRKDENVKLYVNRIEFINPTTRENLFAMQPKITEAASLILPDLKLDCMIYACTSASATIGDDNVKKLIEKAKPDTPCVTPTSAAIAGFKNLGVNKISLIAPYIKSVSEELAHYFSALGLEIASLHYLGIEDDRDIALVNADSIIDCARTAMKVNSDGLFLSCTALRAVSVLAKIESMTKRVAISSNQALFWQALRNCGNDNSISGFGKLLEI